MTVHNLSTPLTDEKVSILNAGDMVYLTGIIYTARDAAHKRLNDLLEKGEELPFDLKGQVIFYAGPSPAKPGQVIGSIGPTTSGRMDKYTVPLLKKGLKGMIGKGVRSSEVVKGITKYNAVYFAAVGGVAALLARRIKKAKVVAYPELGPEAIYELEVEDFPVYVINDSHGKDLYKREN